MKKSSKTGNVIFEMCDPNEAVSIVPITWDAVTLLLDPCVLYPLSRYLLPNLSAAEMLLMLVERIVSVRQQPKTKKLFFQTIRCLRMFCPFTFGEEPFNPSDHPK